MPVGTGVGDGRGVGGQLGQRRGNALRGRIPGVWVEIARLVEQVGVRKATLPAPQTLALGVLAHADNAKATTSNAQGNLQLPCLHHSLQVDEALIPALPIPADEHPAEELRGSSHEEVDVGLNPGPAVAARRPTSSSVCSSKPVPTRRPCS